MVQLIDTQSLPALAEVRQKFHFKSNFEFKYYTIRHEIKEAFFNSAHSIPFRVRAVVADKARLESHWREYSGQELTVELAVGLIMRANPLDIANDVLIIDAATPALCRALRVRLSEECRQHQRARPFGKITGGKSDREDGLQLADMVAGAVRQHSAGEDSRCYQMFVNKVVDLWELPPREK